MFVRVAIEEGEVGRKLVLEWPATGLPSPRLKSIQPTSTPSFIDSKLDQPEDQGADRDVRDEEKDQVPSRWSNDEFQDVKDDARNPCARAGHSDNSWGTGDGASESL